MNIKIFDLLAESKWNEDAQRRKDQSHPEKRLDLPLQYIDSNFSGCIGASCISNDIGIEKCVYEINHFIFEPLN
jgi:hypothetical protein